MSEELKLEEIFCVKRLAPEEAFDVMKTALCKKDCSSLALKSYNITNDEQRFELIRRVLGKELTIKEVLKK